MFGLSEEAVCGDEYLLSIREYNIVWLVRYIKHYQNYMLLWPRVASSNLIQLSPISISFRKLGDPYLSRNPLSMLSSQIREVAVRVG